MKVLRPGEPGTWKGELTCQGGFSAGYLGCKALLEVDDVDLFKVIHTGQRDEEYVYVCFQCCECRAVTKVQGNKETEQKVPQRIVRNLPIKKGPFT